MTAWALSQAVTHAGGGRSGLEGQPSPPTSLQHRAGPDPLPVTSPVYRWGVSLRTLFLGAMLLPMFWAWHPTPRAAVNRSDGGHRQHLSPWCHLQQHREGSSGQALTLGLMAPGDLTQGNSLPELHFTESRPRVKTLSPR